MDCRVVGFTDAGPAAPLRTLNRPTPEAAGRISCGLAAGFSFGLRMRDGVGVGANCRHRKAPPACPLARSRQASPSCCPGHSGVAGTDFEPSARGSVSAAKHRQQWRTSTSRRASNKGERPNHPDVTASRTTFHAPGQGRGSTQFYGAALARRSGKPPNWQVGAVAGSAIFRAALSPRKSTWTLTLISIRRPKPTGMVTQIVQGT